MLAAQAITKVDASAAPDYFLVNCAHPAHVEPGLAGPGRWRERLLGMRYNASAKSHAELDEATELDADDPDLLATAHQRLTPLLPHLSIVGGCCGRTHATSQPCGASTGKPAREKRDETGKHHLPRPTDLSQRTPVMPGTQARPARAGSTDPFHPDLG